MRLTSRNTLPPQLRCCSHTMNLVATSDVENILKNSKNSTFKKLYRSVFGKLQSFYNISHRSTKSQDIIFDIYKCKFPCPVVTRWNSMYDSSKKIYSKKDDIIKVFEALKLTAMTSTDWNFLKEYLNIMEPIAFVIEYFQGEKSSFLGIVAPTINVLVLKLKNLENLKLCVDLRDGLLVCLEKRFPYVLNIVTNNQLCRNFIVAAVSHPKFKLSWVPTQYIETCKNILLKYKNELKEINTRNEHLSDFHETDSTDMDFFSILHKNKPDSLLPSSLSVEMKLLSYFEEKSYELDILNAHPVMKAIFIKFNTTIPSSAPVERLFSTAVQIFTPRRNRHSDKTFRCFTWGLINSFINFNSNEFMS